MKKNNNINIKALMINTVLGFVVSAAVSISAFGFILNENVKTEENHPSWQDAYFGFEDERKEIDVQPVFIHALTEE